MAMKKYEEGLKFIDKALDLDPINKHAIKAREELFELIGGD